MLIYTLLLTGHCTFLFLMDLLKTNAKKAAKYKVHITRASPDDILEHLAHVIIQTKRVSIH